MSRPDHTALQSSGLNPFLYADVGTEPNGSTVTMLSVLARLGHDPWVEAARWAKLPKAKAVDCLINAMAGTPLSGRTISESRTVATHLVTLLPTQERLSDITSAPSPVETASRTVGTSLGMTNLPRWLPLVLLASVLVIGVALNLVRAPGGRAVSPEISQTNVKASGTESR